MLHTHTESPLKSISNFSPNIVKCLGCGPISPHTRTTLCAAREKGVAGVHGVGDVGAGLQLRG